MKTYHVSLPILDEHAANTDASTSLCEAKIQLGFIPNLYGVMANLPGLLETYRFGYAQFRQSSGFSAIEQEVVLLTISVTNECHYCVAAHSTIATHQSHLPKAIIEALRQGTALPDSRLQALSHFTQAMVTQNGRVKNEDAKLFLDAGFTENQMLAVILAVGIKTLSNYTNHLVNTPVDPVFKAQEWHK